MVDRVDLDMRKWMISALAGAVLAKPMCAGSASKLAIVMASEYAVLGLDNSIQMIQDIDSSKTAAV